MNDIPTGIIRTLPPIYADPEHAACINYLESIEEMKLDPDHTICFALSSKPKHDVLHVYLIIKGKIHARFPLVEWRKGGRPVRLWDDTIRTPAFWAVVCGPAELPPHPIPMRGFQGFRYTTGLW